MEFGEYKEKQVFRIEKSKQYTEKLRQQGVRCCEFILLRKNKLYFVEAKQSYPNPINICFSEERKKQYHKDVQEIVEKMRHSLELYASILLNKHSQEGIFDAMKNMKELELKISPSHKKCRHFLDPATSRCTTKSTASRAADMENSGFHYTK